jgi:hypothetical protein
VIYKSTPRPARHESGLSRPIENMSAEPPVVPHQRSCADTSMGGLPVEEPRVGPSVVFTATVVHRPHALENRSTDQRRTAGAAGRGVA